MKAQFSKYGSQPKVLPNTPTDYNKLDMDQLHLQIASVDPYFAEDDTSNRKTEWDRNFNLRLLFYFYFPPLFLLLTKLKRILHIRNSFHINGKATWRPFCSM